MCRVPGPGPRPQPGRAAPALSRLAGDRAPDAARGGPADPGRAASHGDGEPQKLGGARHAHRAPPPRRVRAAGGRRAADAAPGPRPGRSELRGEGGIRHRAARARRRARPLAHRHLRPVVPGAARGPPPGAEGGSGRTAGPGPGERAGAGRGAGARVAGVRARNRQPALALRRGAGRGRRLARRGPVSGRAGPACSSDRSRRLGYARQTRDAPNNDGGKRP